MTPVCMERNPNLLSMVVMTTFTNPFTTIPRTNTYYIDTEYKMIY